MRVFEKYAVKVGGGYNHRFNLSDGILLKDNHIGAAGSVAEAIRMAKEYGTSIYLKAGHLTENTLTDVFFNAETSEIETLSSNRIETTNTHGTGCTLSSALASGLALGYSLSETAKFAHDYLATAIEKGADYKIGGGFGPVHHFWKYWE